MHEGLFCGMYYSCLMVDLFSLQPYEASPYSILACDISAEPSAGSRIGTLYTLRTSFSCSVESPLSLPLGCLVIICLGKGSVGLNLTGAHWPPWMVMTFCGVLSLSLWTSFLSFSCSQFSVEHTGIFSFLLSFSFTKIDYFFSFSYATAFFK